MYKSFTGVILKKAISWLLWEAVINHALLETNAIHNYWSCLQPTLFHRNRWGVYLFIWYLWPLISSIHESSNILGFCIMGLPWKYGGFIKNLFSFLVWLSRSSQGLIIAPNDLSSFSLPQFPTPTQTGVFPPFQITLSFLFPREEPLSPIYTSNALCLF